MIFKKGELFNGPGGFALGAGWAEILDQDKNLYKVTHSWSNDICPDACETYRKNICPEAPSSVINEDVRTLNIESLSEIDAFIFGFPCNDFSNVGKRKGVNGNYGPLYTYGINILKIFKPKWFIAENVGGLQSSNDGEAFKVILKEMIEVIALE